MAAGRTGMISAVPSYALDKTGHFRFAPEADIRRPGHSTFGFSPVAEPARSSGYLE
jgi:hypothetical protein